MVKLKRKSRENKNDSNAKRPRVFFTLREDAIIL